MPSVATAPMHTIRKGDPTSFDENVEVVEILIERDKHGLPTRIDHPADVHICWPGEATETDPTRPRGVLWVAVNLRDHEKLHFRPKEDQFPFFHAHDFVLDAKHRVVSTGPVVRMPKNTHMHRPNDKGQHFWSYSIWLEHPRLDEPVHIDPTIIIDPWP